MKIQNYDNYEVLATPLPDYKDRIWEAGRNKVTTDSFTMSLAKDKVTKAPFILVTHGAGSEAFTLESPYMSLPVLLELAGTNERALYAMLFTLYKTADRQREAGNAESAAVYRNAFVNDTLKKRKQRGSNNFKVWIEDKAA